MKCEQQIEGGDSLTLFHFSEAPVGVGPEEVMEMLRELEPLSSGDRLGELGVFSLEKALGRP